MRGLRLHVPGRDRREHRGGLLDAEQRRRGLDGVGRTSREHPRSELHRRWASASRPARAASTFWTVDFGGYTDPGSVAAGARPDATPGAGTRPSRSRPRHRRLPPRRRLRARPRRRRPRRPAATTTSGGTTGGGRQQREGRLGGQAGSVVAPVTLASHLVAEPDRVKAHPGRAKILHPLRNDDNPESAPLRIVRVLHQPHGSRVRVDARRTQDPAAAPAPRARDEAARVPRHHGIGRGGPGRGDDRHRSELTAPGGPAPQSLRPVMASRTPSPISTRPPAPPMSSRRRGERASQTRAVPETIAHAPSENRPTTSEIAPSSGELQLDVTLARIDELRQHRRQRGSSPSGW